MIVAAEYIDSGIGQMEDSSPVYFAVRIVPIQLVFSGRALPRRRCESGRKGISNRLGNLGSRGVRPMAGTRNLLPSARYAVDANSFKSRFPMSSAEVRSERH